MKKDRRTTAQVMIANLRQELAYQTSRARDASEALSKMRGFVMKLKSITMAYEDLLGLPKDLPLAAIKSLLKDYKERVLWDIQKENL